MNNIVKIWIIVIITTLSAILLPTVIANADEEETTMYSLYGITGYRPAQLCAVGYIDENNEVQISQYTDGGSVNDNGTYHVFYALSRFYHYYNKTTILIAIPCYLDKANNEFAGYGTGEIMCIKSGDLTLSEAMVSAMGFSFYHDQGEVWTNSTNYTSDTKSALLDYFNNGGADVDGLINVQDLFYDNTKDDWLNPNSEYDLEIVQGVKVTIPDGINEDYTIKWTPSEDLQSQEYYRDVELEVYQIFCGRAKQFIWDSWQEYYSEPILISEPFAYKEVWTGYGVDQQNSFVWDFLGIMEGGGCINEVYTSDWALRYKYKDDNGVYHYSSNFVYIQCKKDGTYTISIPETDDKTDIVPDTPTIDTDFYTDEIIISDDDDIKVTNIFDTIKALFNSLKDFPEYFGKIFNMMPTWVTTLLAFGIGALIIIGLLKAIL